MTDEQKIVCCKNGLNLYAQEAYGDCQIVDTYTIVDQRLTKLETLLPLRECKTEVAVFYTTEKEVKVAPLREMLKGYAERLFASKGVKVYFKEFFFVVKDTGVGEQPYDPNGIVGAVNRIQYVQNLLNGKIEWSQKFAKPRLEDFHRIIFPSLESDIKKNGAMTAYDKPNIVFYEYITGKILAGMGRGPGCQADLLKLAQETKDITYGSVVQEKFSEWIYQSINNSAEFSGSNWHWIVLGRDENWVLRDRAYFVNILCDHMMQRGLEQLLK
ncbi:hypothetical protein UA08_06858 [Talaromyces atroroseus]|uniref:Uncharacterized protein n=1 Tax=Talaromyces atroroseus TaxID=1441469 RepID=A0A225AU95_TALAT|nr:hypothetical protein UA08_06858 [Talaromyces atroroseus]OKL57985.1 hypothetical protein UA08_06858 [Talaromyces atroroseus]